MVYIVYMHVDHIQSSHLIVIVYHMQAEFQVNLLLQCLHEAQDHALYQLVANQLQQCKLFFKIRPSPVACHSLGYLLPLLSPTTVTLDHLDEQCLVLLSKGLQKG